MPTNSNLQTLGMLTAAPPGRKASVIAVAILSTSVVISALLAAFARISLVPIDAFMPAYEAALTIIYLITAVLLESFFAPTNSGNKRTRRS